MKRDKHHQYRVGTLQLQAAPNWWDVTHELDDTNAPFTLAKPDGIGVLQFSTATPRRGASPSIGLVDLTALLDEFCESHGFISCMDAYSSETNGVVIVARSTRALEIFYRVWYWSDGSNVVLATYNCTNDPMNAELEDCELMIRSLH